MKLRRQSGLCSHPDDVHDSEFVGYNPTGSLDDEGEDGAPPFRSPSPPTPAETVSGSGSGSESGSVEAEVVAVQAETQKGQGCMRPREIETPAKGVLAS